ncbi:MAG: SusC/RagA family TonB-linked outer membrane protein [Gemmatimonadaceae bacterium]|nr:SusC/RagA family TonB-linked outer membrane protein [Gemmatimonadaceae bacterium]
MKSVRKFVISLLVTALTPAMLLAQQATVSGRVTTQGGNAIPGAAVFIEGLNVGSTTNESGSYSFAVPGGMVSGQSVTITSRRIGYSASSARITLSPGTIVQNFVLGLNPLRLGEVVVTGAGTTTQVEKLGHVRSTVDSTQIQRSNESNVVNALAGKAPNVEVSSASGEAGASSYIRIRGGRSFNNSGQPLFVVDGQPIDNSTIATGSSTASTAAPNRAADINPADIENIEILKGAAAAAIYGARAGQGVILITTKSGRPGPTRYSFRSTISTDEVNSDYPLQRSFAHGSGGLTPIQYRVNGVGSFRCTSLGCGTLTGGSYGPAIPAGLATYDHFGELFRTGSTVDNVISISGGNERTLFYISAERLDQKGIIIGPNNFYDRTSVRLKGSHRVTDRLNVGGNVAFVDSRGAFIQKGSNISGLLLGGLRTPPEFNNAMFRDTLFGLHRSYRYPNPTGTSQTRARGYDNPFFVVNDFRNTGEVGRTFGNINAEYTPIDWLTARWTMGADYYADERLEGFPLTASDPGGSGRVNRVTFTNLNIDHNLLLTGTRTFNPWLAGTLTLGQNLNSRRFKQFFAQGGTLVAPEPFQLDNTIATNLTTDEFESLIHAQSYFAQTTVDLWNQVFLTGSLRNDGFSTFGKSKQRHWFPKVSAAWNFGDRFGMGGLIPSGKLRVAYGEAGQEPPVYATISGLATGSFYDGWLSFFGLSTSQAGQGGLASSITAPQPNLGPERSKELEAGFDVGLFRNLADLSFTWYNSRSEDVILFLPISPAGTGYLQQAANAAKISNKGVEVSLNVRPITRPNFAWDLGFNFGRNRNEVLDLAGAEFIDVQGAAGSFTGAAGSAFEGSALPILRGQDFVRCGRGLRTEDGREVDALCGSAPKGALFLDTNGFPVEDPTNRILGDPNADWTGSVRTGFTLLRKLTLTALVDIKQGGDIWNGTKGALYNFGTHKDTEFRNVDVKFGTNYMPACPNCSGAVGGPGVGTTVKIDQSWYQGLGSGFGAVSQQFFEDASFVKLREISVGYTLSNPAIFRGLGLSAIDLRLAGRNLRTWTDYTGIDPETNLGGAEVANRGVDYFNNPQTRSIVFSIGLSR